MGNIRKLLKLDKIDYYETHLSLINCILPKEVRMTPMEIKVLGAFMSLGENVSRYRFTSTAKKLVMSSVNPEKEISPAGLSNYLKSLTLKGFLKKEDDMIYIHPIVEVNEHEQSYSFRIINNNSNDKTIKEEKQERFNVNAGVTGD